MEEFHVQIHVFVFLTAFYFLVTYDSFLVPYYTYYAIKLAAVTILFDSNNKNQIPQLNEEQHHHEP